MKKKKNTTSKVSLKGRKDEYILTVEDKDSYQDMALLHCEIELIYYMLKKKLE